MEVSKFQFANPNLIKMVFNLNDGFQPQTEEEGIVQSTPLQVNVSVGGRQETSAVVRLTISIGEEGIKFPFYLSAAMCAEFHWSKEVPQEQADRFLRISAPNLLVGYLRPYIVSITEASPVQTIHLPFLDFASDERSGN